MQNKNNFWGRTMKKLWTKYFGWDWRVIPFLGFVALVVSVILLNIPLWQKLAIGYAPFLILLVCYALAVYDVWREDILYLKPIEDLINSRRGKLKEFVFPYMRDFNAYQIVRGTDNIVSLTVYFPSLLLDEVELKLKCQLIIDGNSCIPLSIGKVKFFRDSIGSKSFDYPIVENKRAIEVIKSSASEYKAIRVILKIWDEDNDRIYWETPDWSVLPFA